MDEELIGLQEKTLQENSKDNCIAERDLVENKRSMRADPINLVAKVFDTISFAKNKSDGNKEKISMKVQRLTICHVVDIDKDGDKPLVVIADPSMALLKDSSSLSKKDNHIHIVGNLLESSCEEGKENAIVTISEESPSTVQSKVGLSTDCTNYFVEDNDIKGNTGNEKDKVVEPNKLAERMLIEDVLEHPVTKIKDETGNVMGVLEKDSELKIIKVTAPEIEKSILKSEDQEIDGTFPNEEVKLATSPEILIKDCESLASNKDVETKALDNKRIEKDLVNSEAQNKPMINLKDCNQQRPNSERNVAEELKEKVYIQPLLLEDSLEKLKNEQILSDHDKPKPDNSVKVKEVETGSKLKEQTFKVSEVIEPNLEPLAIIPEEVKVAPKIELKIQNNVANSHDGVEEPLKKHVSSVEAYSDIKSVFKSSISPSQSKEIIAESMPDPIEEVLADYSINASVAFGSDDFPVPESPEEVMQYPSLIAPADFGKKLEENYEADLQSLTSDSEEADAEIECFLRESSYGLPFLDAMSLIQGQFGFVILIPPCNHYIGQCIITCKTNSHIPQIVQELHCQINTVQYINTQYMQ
eukprot:TRINITY_DN1368_c0_g1_i1.p2 TRINITY_DN1368_c0_g1~~TRINITY_DN1368_c0_g1_i1.p2  ORF type:complete len:585 (-),score=67.90 TRINITY_DN1368_c0_g1_i1:460-2214(-)